MFCAMLLTIALTAPPPQPPFPGGSNPWPRTGVVKVRLFDVFTAQPIADSEVKVFSDNGFRCFMAPCPTDGAEWRGRSDRRGYLDIPAASLKRETTISTSLHDDGDLTLDAPRDLEGARIVELFPESLGTGGPGDLGVSDFKLIDARTGKAVANARVRFTLDEKNIEAITNALGYAFIPAQDVMAADHRVSVTAPGYRRKKVPDAGWRNVTRLERATQESP